MSPFLFVMCVIMLIVVMLIVVMLIVVMLTVVMQTVVIMSVIMLNVIAPGKMKQIKRKNSSYVSVKARDSHSLQKKQSQFLTFWRFQCERPFLAGNVIKHFQFVTDVVAK
jgi:hypothetical protein